MSKLAAKLFKSAKENSGTIANAWHFVANDFEQTAEVQKKDFIFYMFSAGVLSAAML